MRKRKFRYFMGDFETTVYEGQTSTEVWASASVELNTEDVHILHSIGEQLDYFISFDEDIICYYHNLKFDGMFWLSYLLNERGFKQAFKDDGASYTELDFKDIKDMPNNSVSYLISDMGQWYNITLKVHNRLIIFKDSLKLLPFSVKTIGETFGTKHKKLEMEYKGYRYAGCYISPEEREYIANDVLVVKEALEIMFAEGHTKNTIGGCCLDEFKKGYDREEYKGLFPNVYEIELDETQYKYKNAGEYIKRSYRGGWCYLVKGKENQIKENGVTADVNSLYPSMMSSESGNSYPYGKPTFWKGNYIPDEALKPHRYYFVRVRTRFYLKPGKLPFIQIKNSLMYNSTESLSTSDVYDPRTGIYYAYYKDKGVIKPAIVEMVWTMTDYQLIKEHYDLVDFEILDGCYFYSLEGLFDNYINKYKKIKMESKGAKRQLAKLFLNNLYGKMATNPISSFKVAIPQDDGSLGFITVEKYDKLPGYIPIGSAITSYARCFTIKAAQANFYGVDKPGFIYADTDSIHCDLPAEEIKGIKVDPKDFCCWKLESSWDTAIFVRQKTYIEHIIKEDLETIANPYYNVKCAGCPDRCKKLFIESMTGEKLLDDYNEEQLKFLQTKRTLEDFKIGLIIPGKLLPKKIKGGVLLVDTTFEMR